MLRLCYGYGRIWRIGALPVHTPTEQILADYGIPVSECPTCKTCNWEFHGAVDVGIYTVTCQTCGRRYEMMSRQERVSYWASKLASAMDTGACPHANEMWSALVSAWNEPLELPGRRGAVVTATGDYDNCDTDELRF